MQIKPITEDYAVSPQITPEDVAAIREAGFGTIICNRPDAEVPADVQADAVRKAAEAEGLTFVDNPFSHQAFSPALVETQTAAREAATGRVLAYCASGNRCSILWALGETASGRLSPDEAISLAAGQGYDLSGLRPQLEAAAAR